MKQISRLIPPYQLHPYQMLWNDSTKYVWVKPDSFTIAMGFVKAATVAAGYQPIGNYALSNRTLTINGSTQDLSANRIFNVGTILPADTVNARNYSNAIYLAGASVSGKLNISDSAAIYQTKFRSDTNRTNVYNALALRVKYTDTAAQVAGIYTALNARLLKSDSATYASKFGIDSMRANIWTAIAAKLSTPTVGIAARTVNTNFTPSTTRPVYVTYTLTCQVTNPLIAGTSSATVFLEYSINGGTSWLLPAQGGNSSNVGVTVTIQLTNVQTGIVDGWIPANALCRIRTTTTGTATVTYVTGEESVF